MGVRTAVGICGIAATSLVVAAAAPAGAAGSCEVEALPLPQPARESAVTVGDPSGRWLGGYLVDGPDGEALSEPLLWHDGQLVPFEPTLGLASIDGINRHGVVVGRGYDDSGAARPFAVVDGETVPLAEPAGASYSMVTGVSADGTVVGFSSHPDGDAAAVTWSLDRPDEVVPLPLPQRVRSSMARGVSGHGQVVVDARTTDNRSRVFLFGRSGKRVELRGLVKRSSLEALSIANGWLVARERSGAFGENIQHLRFDLRAHEVERVPFGGAVNARGTIGGQVGEDAALYTGSVTRLPTLEDVPNGGSVATVDRAGQPAGQAGASAADASVAVRWDCG